MKLKKMEQLCFENNLYEFDLLIYFIEKITDKKEISYHHYEFGITEENFIEWIKRFKSGNPIKEMNQMEITKFISIVMRYLRE